VFEFRPERRKLFDVQYLMPPDIRPEIAVHMGERRGVTRDFSLVGFPIWDIAAMD
jgi:hypothetical protein